jgi:hypothetical protein
MPDEPINLNAIPPDPLAEALARLAPMANLDRDRILFAAGAASRRSTIRLWQAASGFLAALGFAAGVLAYTNTTSPFEGRQDPPAKTIPTPK